MKAIKNIGLILCFIGFAIFTGSIFTGTNKVSQETFNTWAKQKVKSAFFIEKAQKEIVDIELSAFELSHRITEIAKASNIYHKSQKKIAWNKIIPLKWNKTSKDFIYPLARASATGWPQQNEGLFFWITFGLAILGGTIAFATDYKLLGKAGIKNNGIFQHSATNRGYLGILTFFYFVGFYVVLYFFPNCKANSLLAL